MNEPERDLASDIREGKIALDVATPGTGGSGEQITRACETSWSRSIEGLMKLGATTSPAEHKTPAPTTPAWNEEADNLEIGAIKRDAHIGERSPTANLAESLHTVTHLRILMDERDPNHENAMAAARLPADKRLDSMEFAACELVAQETVRKTFEDNGVAFEPFNKTLTDRCRPQWEKIANDPAAMTRVEESITRGCDDIRTMPYTEPPRASATRGTGRPVGGEAPPAPAAERAPTRS